MRIWLNELSTKVGASKPTMKILKAFFAIILASLVTEVVSQSSTREYVGFHKLGTYENPDTSSKSYYIATHFKVFWYDALAICHSFGMEMLTLDTQPEANNFYNLANSNLHLFDSYVHIGAMSKTFRSASDWYWNNTGERVNIELKWPPGEPNNAGGKERCLSLDKRKGHILYNDIACYDAWKQNFICQKKTADMNIDLRGSNSLY